jgi:hypothetical protein
MTAWSWQYEAADGTVMHASTLPCPAFPNQAEAEAWIGEVWRELAGAGIESVSLLRDGDVVYAGMSLRPAE